MFSACPFSKGCTTQEFQEYLNTRSKLTGESAVMGGQVHPTLKELLVEQMEVLGAKLSFVLWKEKNFFLCVAFNSFE